MSPVTLQTRHHARFIAPCTRVLVHPVLVALVQVEAETDAKLARIMMVDASSDGCVPRRCAHRARRRTARDGSMGEGVGDMVMKHGRTVTELCC